MWNLNGNFWNIFKNKLSIASTSLRKGSASGTVRSMCCKPKGTEVCRITDVGRSARFRLEIIVRIGGVTSFNLKVKTYADFFLNCRLQCIEIQDHLLCKTHRTANSAQCFDHNTSSLHNVHCTEHFPILSSFHDYFLRVKHIVKNCNLNFYVKCKNLPKISFTVPPNCKIWGTGIVNITASKKSFFPWRVETHLQI